MKSYRARKKAKGYVKREVWVPPQMHVQLKIIERALQQGIVPIVPTNQKGNVMHTATTLQQDLENLDGVTTEIILSTDNSFVVRLEDQEELPILVTVTNSVVLMSTVLFNVNDLPDEEAANIMFAMLQANPNMPLSAFGVLGDNFVIYGELSANSIISSVHQELFTLADNTLQALEMVEELLSQ